MRRAKSHVLPTVLRQTFATLEGPILRAPRGAAELTLSETASAPSAITMPLTANDANEQLNDDRKEHRKEQGKNSRYEKIRPFRQPLPSRQWKPDERFDPPVQKTNFWFDRMPLTPH